jgi:integrase
MLPLYCHQIFSSVRHFLWAARPRGCQARQTVHLLCGDARYWLRPGEAVALMWKDFDPMKSTLTIQRSFGDVGEHHDFKPTKTAKGRQIKLPENLTKLLLEHKEKQAFSSHLIFPTVNNTPYNERNIVNRHFKPLLEKAKLGEYLTVKNSKGEDTLKFTSPYRLYDLRHTHATLLLKAGVNPKIVSERLGHSSVRITLDIYSHVLPGMQDEAASKLDLMLTFQRPEPVATAVN